MLATFLATAGEEALTWECKGGRVRAEHVIRTVAGLANSELGGYLILGANWSNGHWELDGIELDDATAWVSNAIERLSPRPFYDACTVSDEATGSQLVVVAVEPVGEPPCLTPDGVVFERVVGQTVPVRDASRLAALFARGEAAERDAREAVSGAILQTIKPEGASGGALPAVMIGLAAIGEVLDLERHLFSEGYEELLRGELNRWWDGRRNDCRPVIEYAQDHLEGSIVCAFHESRRVRTTSRLSGVATIALFDSEREDGLDLVQDRQFLGRIWESVRGLLVGFVPDARAAILALDVVRGTDVKGLERRISLVDSADLTIDSIHRELRRARGEEVWEPA